jgi:PIN domain nuclease of toxin-antitoxin system
MSAPWKSEPVVVLDACALIAFLNDESGADLVASILQEVPVVEMAAINVLEVAYDAVRTTGKVSAAAEILNSIRELPIDIRWLLDEAMIEIAARLKTSYRVSLADSVALALAISRNAPLATSDHHEFDSVRTAGAARFLWIR